MKDYYEYYDKNGELHIEGYIRDCEEDELDYCRMGNMEK